MSEDLSPTVRSYLEGLPRGADSYPDCVAKGAVMRSVLDSLSFEDCMHRVPPAVAELLRHPPPVTSWVSEVHAVCVLMLARDRHFATDEAFLGWVKERNQALLHGPMYRVLMMVLSPSILVHGAERRWSAFHRGTKLRVEMMGSHAEARFLFPVGMWNALMIRALSIVLEVVLEGSGAKNVRMGLTALGPGTASVVASWSA
jgi:hypothetical protein